MLQNVGSHEEENQYYKLEKEIRRLKRKTCLKIIVMNVLGDAVKMHIRFL